MIIEKYTDEIDKYLLSLTPNRDICKTPPIETWLPEPENKLTPLNESYQTKEISMMLDDVIDQTNNILKFECPSLLLQAQQSILNQKQH
jgi:hypothetical protein